MSKAGKVAGTTLAGTGTGAAIGTAIMPGVGTAIGGGIGAVGGFLSSIFDDDEGPTQIAPADPRDWAEWDEYSPGAITDQWRDKDGDIVSGTMARFEAPKAMRDEADRAFNTQDASTMNIDFARAQQLRARRNEYNSRNRSLESRGASIGALGQSQQARNLEMQGRGRFSQGLDTLQNRAQGNDLMAYRAAQIERERNQAAMMSMANSAGGYNPAAQRAAIMQGSQLQSQSAGATALAAQAEQRGYQDKYMEAVDQQRMRDQGLRQGDFGLADQAHKLRQLDQYGRSQDQAMRAQDQAQQGMEQQWWQQQNAQNWAKDAARYKWLQQGYDERQRRAQNRLNLLGIAQGQGQSNAAIAASQAQAAQQRQDNWLMAGMSAAGQVAGMYGRMNGSPAAPNLGYGTNPYGKPNNA